MAYDPNDAADKKILADAIAAALAEQAEEHEAELTGLKAKKTELLGKIAKLKAGNGDDTDTGKLEADLEAARGDLKKLNRDLAKATADLTAATTERDGLSKNLHTLLVDQGLTTVLTEAKVDSKFLPAVKAFLSPRVELKGDGSERKAFVGEKSLGDFVKEWSQGDEGKAYIAAPSNGGGGGGGNPQGGNGGGKQMTRSAYEATPQADRAAFFAEGGTLVDD